MTGSPNLIGQTVCMNAADHPHAGEVGKVVKQWPCPDNCGYDVLRVDLGGELTEVFEPEATPITPLMLRGLATRQMTDFMVWECKACGQRTLTWYGDTRRLDACCPELEKTGATQIFLVEKKREDVPALTAPPADAVITPLMGNSS